MLTRGILNPELRSLLARVRHTNGLIIADRGFPFWPEIETVDLALTNDIPTVLQVLTAIREDFQPVHAFMADEFLKENQAAIKARFAKALKGIPTTYEPHSEFKNRVPSVIGLIRTGDTIPYANLILISG